MRQVVEPCAVCAIAADKIVFARPLEVADGAKAVFFEARLGDLANPEDERDRPGREETSRFAMAQNCKSARLVDIGRNFGEELVAGEAYRYRDTYFALDVCCKFGKHLGG